MDSTVTAQVGAAKMNVNVILDSISSTTAISSWAATRNSMKMLAYAVKIQLHYTMSLLYRICGGVISLIQLCQWIRKIVAHLAWKTVIVEQYCIRVIIAANISFRIDLVE